MQKITIDIVSDVVCPWCAIGYHSLTDAIESAGLSQAVELNWIPFELNPDMPREGKAHLDYGRDKYSRSPEQARASLKHVEDSAAAAGFEINFPEEPRIYNTFDAHRLLHWAKESGLQTKLKQRLFQLFFQEQGNPSSEEDLLKCANDVGLDVRQAKQILASDMYEAEVRAELRSVHQADIASVPTFILNNKYLITGGQPKETFANILTKLSTDPA